MFHKTFLLLVILVAQVANADELFSVDPNRIRQVALDAALLKYPEYLPGDLVSEEGPVFISCWPKHRYLCVAHISFNILSSVVREVNREDDKCVQLTTTNHIAVNLLPDGSVSRIINSGTSSGEEAVECPIAPEAEKS